MEKEEEAQRLRGGRGRVFQWWGGGAGLVCWVAL